MDRTSDDLSKMATRGTCEMDFLDATSQSHFKLKNTIIMFVTSTFVIIHNPYSVFITHS